MSSSIGHFGGLVIGEEKAEAEQSIVKRSAHIFGPLVVDPPTEDEPGQVHAAGPLVTDETVVEIIEKAGGGAPMPDFNPAQLLAVNTKEATAIVAEKADVRVLKVWRETELLNEEYEGGRKGVLKAIDARVGELTV